MKTEATDPPVKVETTELGRIALRRRLMAMGISQAYASELSNCKRKPKLALSGRIHEETGLPVDAWVHGDPAERMWDVLVDEAIAKREKDSGPKDRARGAA